MQVGEIILNAHSDDLAETQYTDEEDSPLDLNSQQPMA
jgi:hypothetical protein